MTDGIAERVEKDRRRNVTLYRPENGDLPRTGRLADERLPTRPRNNSSKNFQSLSALFILGQLDEIRPHTVCCLSALECRQEFFREILLQVEILCSF